MLMTSLYVMSRKRVKKLEKSSERNQMQSDPMRPYERVNESENLKPTWLLHIMNALNIYNINFSVEKLCALIVL